MISERIRGLIGMIEGRYGDYEGDEDEAVGGYLEARLDQDCIVEAFEAIRQGCPLRFGPPDEATVKRALVDYEDETGTRLRRKLQGAERSAPEPEPVTAEEELQLREIAAQAGIDTTRDGWMERYLFRRLGDLAQAKRYVG
jgi:hypothetical protein